MPEGGAREPHVSSGTTTALPRRRRPAKVAKMKRFSSAPLASLLLLCVLGPAGCGDDSETSSSGSGGSGGETSSASSSSSSSASATTTSSSGGVLVGELGAVSAPTRDTVLATYQTDAAPPSDAAAYVIDSDRGPLAVTAVTIDAAARTVALTTAPQKLGVEYTLAVQSPNGPYDGQEASFLAADTVELWATDLEDPNFTDYLVVARRVAVGEHAVLYLEEGQEASDIQETVEAFDDVIYPIETEAFREPPDIDDNGKVLLLGLDGGFGYAGYFSPLNTLSVEEAAQFGANSNAMEMIYFNVAIEPYFGFDPYGVVPHEYLHLLYAEEHGIFSDWSYHNEGLAECAVTQVWGANDTAAWVYASDYYGDLQLGKSLVQWEYSNYSQYAQAYVFWTYAAGQLGPETGYSRLFHTDGAPESIDAFFRSELGRSFGEVQLGFLTAAWAQEEDGEASFAGMLTLPERPQRVPFGTTELSLPPYGGVFFGDPSDSTSPIGAGPNVVHRGLDADSAIDDSDPFATAGGTLLALNTRLADLDDTETQSSGTVATPDALAATAPRPARSKPSMPEEIRRRLRLHAPPVVPWHPAMQAYLRARALD
jgi:hypothetical protein